MYELFPILAGVVIALVTQRLPARARLATIAALSLLAGASAAWVSGEWLESWAFVLIDTALVTMAAVVTVAAIAWWRSHQRRLG